MTVYEYLMKLFQFLSAINILVPQIKYELVDVMC